MGILEFKATTINCVSVYCVRGYPRKVLSVLELSLQVAVELSGVGAGDCKEE